MSKTYHDGSRKIRVRAERRDMPDVRKLARALIDLAIAEAEAETEHRLEEQQQAEAKSQKAQPDSDSEQRKDAA